MPYLLWHWGFLEVLEKVPEKVRHWKSIRVPELGRVYRGQNCSYIIENYLVITG